MLKCPVYLYTNLFDVVLDLDQNTRTYNIMYQRDLKIQKGLQNKIQFQFKNSDQKRLTINNDTYVFSMFDAVDRRLLVEKQIEILDDGATATTRGLGLLTLKESDTLNLPKGYYKFSVKRYNSDGSYEPAYANTYYSVNGTLEILEDVFPVLQPSQEVTNFQPIYNIDPGAQWFEFYSGNLRAHPEFKSGIAQHTMAFYLNKFKGIIKIQGSQENSVDTFSNFALINTIRYNTATTGLRYTNFTGLWSFVRIIFIPDTSGQYNSQNFLSPSMPGNPTPGVSFYPNGKLDKLIYRS
jgi:hypothetical protein